MAWLLVVVAGIFETGFAVLLKQSHGITRLAPTAGFAVCALISFGLLTLALRHLEVGPAYAAWTGIGAAGTALVGITAAAAWLIWPLGPRHRLGSQSPRRTGGPGAARARIVYPAAPVPLR